MRCEPYPHPNPLVRLLDYAVLCFGFIVAAATLPQAFIIWTHKSAEDVSLISWSFYTINAALYFLYAIVHREGPLLIGAALLFIVDILVVLGILLYS